MTDQREPTLEDILNEPIIQQVMLSDGVNADEVRLLMSTAAAREDHGTDGLEVACYARTPLFACAATAA
jgi:hypothetical protein